MTAYETLTTNLSDSTNHNALELGGNFNALVSRTDMENYSSVKMACGFGDAEEHLPEFGFEEEGGNDQADAVADEDATTDDPRGATTDNPRGSTQEPSEDGEVMTDAEDDGEVNRCPF